MMETYNEQLRTLQTQMGMEELFIGVCLLCHLLLTKSSLPTL
jgi:hypothetical protein